MLMVGIVTSLMPNPQNPREIFSIGDEDIEIRVSLSSDVASAEFKFSNQNQ